jgi:hypothetical protein
MHYPQTTAAWATELRAVGLLQRTDILQLSTDPRLYRVVTIERTGAAADAPFRVSLESACGTSAVSLMRGGRELVLAVPRSPAPLPQ